MKIRILKMIRFVAVGFFCTSVYSVSFFDDYWTIIKETKDNLNKKIEEAKNPEPPQPQPSLNHAPYPASNPNPADNATDIGTTNIILSWTGGDPDGDTVRYDLWFGTETLSKIESQLTNTFYNIPLLVASTTYFWKVEAKDEHGSSSAGPIWQFQTKIPPPPPIPKPEIVLSANPTEIYVGSSSILIWTSTNSSSVWITDIGWVPLSGSQTISPLTSTTYVAIATGQGGGTATSMVTINIIFPPPPPSNQAPVAYIDSINPNPATVGTTVNFAGYGSDTDGMVTTYSWVSNLAGWLSNSPIFSTSILSLGTHTISFQVQDDKGSWSVPVVTQLVILSPPPQPPIPDGYVELQRITKGSNTYIFLDNRKENAEILAEAGMNPVTITIRMALLVCKEEIWNFKPIDSFLWYVPWPSITFIGDITDLIGAVDENDIIHIIWYPHPIHENYFYRVYQYSDNDGASWSEYVYLPGGCGYIPNDSSGLPRDYFLIRGDEFQYFFNDCNNPGGVINYSSYNRGMIWTSAKIIYSYEGTTEIETLHWRSIMSLELVGENDIKIIIRYMKDDYTKWLVYCESSNKGATWIKTKEEQIQ